MGEGRSPLSLHLSEVMGLTPGTVLRTQRSTVKRVMPASYRSGEVTSLPAPVSLTSLGPPQPDPSLEQGLGPGQAPLPEGQTGEKPPLPAHVSCSWC